MSMNKYMHPRNIYKTPPDFKQLAIQFPDFQKYVKLDISGKPVFDFKDPNALRALSRTLLKKDFNLDVEMPSNKLVPTIPLRLNYILWIEDLLGFIQKEGIVKGIDIGTGASCIYPLMAAKKNNWKMLATETDDESVVCARKNIEMNNLQELITVKKVSCDYIFKEALNVDEEFDFCMCNPPFFSSTQELHPFFKSRKQNRPHPKNAFVASVNEVVSKGGEVEFVQKIIKESREIGKKIKIYTSMVGQKSSLPILKKSLREAEVNSFKEVEFCQGNTTRWGLAWTFADYDLKKVTDATKLSLVKSSKKHPPLLYEMPDSSENIAQVTENILKIFQNLKMTVEEVTRNKLHQRYFVSAYSNTWSHQRRKRRENMRRMSEKNDEASSPEKNNNDGSTDESDKSPNKRTLDDICESTTKKLRLSTDSESSETVVFFKFMCALNCQKDKIILELNTIEEQSSNRDYLHQIMQYVKNKWKCLGGD
ncbi:U6 small nuclear RNA (adenine-(43)-N(6))-methyltransferase [Anthonomus grandis grandis]|uniref:U6 small nuclear RNA (adenine-(43)-N(6))-methyltransferase n=1 Tax=Anthonomus grandis grandis TaxID=2921223 RepID=UPI0021656EF6|nr:U6 small nuclear RNA (adenine-(43)-N(6))-methyltransferase [Anthonomus grandis grandis]